MKIVVSTADGKEEVREIERPNIDTTRLEIQSQIQELKHNLESTDYQAIKFAEGELSTEVYTPIKEQRIQWRKQINELEDLLNKGNK